MAAIDRIADDPQEAVKDAQIVILCTPVSKLSPMIAKIGPVVSEGAVITDVGSTKESVVAAGEKGIPAGPISSEAIPSPAAKSTVCGSHGRICSTRRSVFLRQPL